MLERFILWTLAPDDVEFAEEDLDEAGGEGDDDEDELSSRSRLFLPPVKNESSFGLKDTGSFRQRFLGDGGRRGDGERVPGGRKHRPRLRGRDAGPGVPARRTAGRDPGRPRRDGRRVLAVTVELRALPASRW